VAIFHHYRYSCFVEFLGKETEIAKFTATIEFDTIKTKVDRCLNIANIVIGSVENFGVPADRSAPRSNILMLVTAAVVRVPVSTHYRWESNKTKFQWE
jgi:hypothetical protein